MRNEAPRIPFFLEYYRNMGINHFVIVDNDSSDETQELLADQPDVSLWTTPASYSASRFGVDWMNYLLGRYGHGHWCLTVDPDEFFVFPFCDTRPLRALTDWLDDCEIRSFGTLLLDLYPKSMAEVQPYRPGDNPMATADWFDPGNLSITRNPALGNLWIQGGVRSRVFFKDKPGKAPALNKVPLVKWHRTYTYVSSTHDLLIRGLNLVYDEWGGEKATGVLLHTKFLPILSEKAAEELQRREHFKASREYRAYSEHLDAGTELWCPWSERYLNWRQLEVLGLMSQGNWA